MPRDELHAWTLLVRHARETDHGPVDPVTDEMVEAGASALALDDGYDPNSVDPEAWADMTEEYRRRARLVVEAALKERDQ